MNEPVTYLGASSCHLYCENYKFQPNTPLRVFGKDETCDNITWIDVTKCAGTLDQDTFKNLPNLEIINLDKCNIETVKENTFSHLPALKSLSIRKSSVPLDQHIFKNCEKLDNLRFIQIENGFGNPSVFQNLKPLEYLMIDHIHGLKLTNDSFCGLNNLKYLFIQNCVIDVLDEDVFKPLVELETIYLTGNQLRQLNEKHLLHLNNLKILGLYDNSFSETQEIDYQMFEHMPNLETINFPEEIIKKINFKGFKNLRTVQQVIGKSNDDIFEYVQNKSLEFQWTSSADLTEEVDFSDPNLIICA